MRRIVKLLKSLLNVCLNNLNFKAVMLLTSLLLSYSTIHAQNASEILRKSYDLAQNNNEDYSAKYKVTYISDVDTGKSNIEFLNILRSKQTIKMFNEEFISLATPVRKLYIDHLSRQVVYFPQVKAENDSISFSGLLSIYLPQSDDSISYVSDNKYHKITIIPKIKKIKKVEYWIDKNSNEFTLISIWGSVHPVAIDETNAKMQVELLEKKKGKKALLKPEDFSFDTYITKKNTSYLLVKYTDYQLQIIGL